MEIKRLTHVKCEIPECESEHYQIKRITVTEEDAKRFNLRAVMSFSGGGRTIKAGTYTKLTRKGTFDTIMSDTPSEIGDCCECVQMAYGQILINGLGLGWILEACLQRTLKQPLPYYYISDQEIARLSKQPDTPLVTHATVIEIDKELIDLVGPYYQNKYSERLTIIHADALKYKPKPNTKFTMVWHDIWPNICADNLTDMKRLHRKYGKRTKWQGSWCRKECEHQLNSNRY